ncbi:adenosylcobinamide-GDP ribazoletransferase [Chitinasiproducens palmae]
MWAMRARWVTEWRHLIAAFAYFTRVPMPAIGSDAPALAAAGRYFPLVGLFVGGCGALVLLLAACLWPPTIAAGLALATTALLTGALHEDGLADCCDGLGGAFSRDDVLRIMRDSRIGAFGAIGLVLALGLRWQAIAALPTPLAAWVVLVAHPASRSAAISLVWALPYARESGKAQAITAGFGTVARSVAVLTGLPWLFWLDWRCGVAMLLTLLALRAALLRWFKRRIGGYTGDCLGLAQQLAELSIYLVALAWYAR